MVPVETLQPRIEARLRIKNILTSVVYDMNAEDSPTLAAAMSSYWAKPAATYLPVGHLKLRLEAIEATYAHKGHLPRPGVARTKSDRSFSYRLGSTSRPPVITLKISDLSIFEYLASDTTPLTDEPADAPPGGAYPLLIFDSNLPKQYDTGSSAPSHSPSKPSTSPARSTVFPEYDAFDWRNSGLQKKTGGGEKAWKVRQKGRGAMKGAAVSEEEGVPVVSVRKELSPLTRELQRFTPDCKTDIQLVSWICSPFISFWTYLSWKGFSRCYDPSPQSSSPLEQIRTLRLYLPPRERHIRPYRQIGPANSSSTTLTLKRPHSVPSNPVVRRSNCSQYDALSFGSISDVRLRQADEGIGATMRTCEVGSLR